MKNSKQSRIAFFIPHEGCTHKCSFCNQNAITSTSSTPTINQIDKTLQNEYRASDISKRRNTQIAYFGGSFTAIEKDRMISFLQVAQKYIGNDGFCGIRISTRPDYIDKQTLDILSKHSVKSIELGAQSMDDRVLKKNLRGHTKEDTKRASDLIKSQGFELGLQMMIGLCGQDTDSVMQTKIEVKKLNPDTVRIYPVLVLKGTLMEKWYLQGDYKPLSLEKAVDITSNLIDYFRNKSIKVIKTGLHAQKSLEKDMLKGPYHPAFGELCENAIFYKKIKQRLYDKEKREYNIHINPNDYSKAIGHKKLNLIKFNQEGINIRFIKDENIKKTQIKIM